MTFSKFLPVAASVGVLAAFWVVIGSTYALVLWVPFLSWALVFGAGAGKLSRVPKELIGLAGGTIAAVAVLLLLPVVTSIVGPTFALPVLVFVAATLIVSLELTNWFELAPAYFFGFAGYFAYLFGGFAGVTNVTTENTLMYLALLFIGTGFGVITVVIRSSLLTLMGVPKDQWQTIFDKEKK